MTDIKCDLCIIGAGSAGLSIASGAAQLGRKVVLIEKGKMGGDCLNYGCVPSKSLLASAKTAQGFRTAEKFGIGAVEPDVDFAKVHDHIHSVIAAIEPNDSQERFEKLGCTVLREAARFIGPREVMVGADKVRAKHFVIATGSRPFVPPIEGLESVPYLTNETLFDRTSPPRHLLIIGGGPIGLEMAQAHRRLGAEVTVMERGTIMPKDDPELVEIVRQRLIEEGVVLHEHTDITRVGGQDGAITVQGQKSGGAFDASGSHLLVAVGRRANFESLDLEKAGVETHDKGIKVNDRLRTSNKRIYAIGDVIGGRQFTHVAGYHANIAVRNILFKMPTKNKDDIAPWVTYTDPELAHVGLNVGMADEKREKYTVAEWSYDENDRAQAEHANAGRAKVLVGKGGHILGCTIVGKNAGDLIGPWALAVANKLKIGAFTSMIAPYPTLTEVSKRAASAYYSPTLFSGKTRKLVSLLSIFD
ncbi:dihydrolipoyl dehydrogenase family protein [Parvularcula sp. LCG005]|uniref:dihydrolipoyl dehydrogenase family protein n=1 Tax=Parvularcula sp. LCG005 TaxID=3078805 RepID=UPI002943D938|nr:FAD-dependent oxidoreductase [Parvularcula sp. LCG005]WOI52062.1 FAD-dependent oxidoreductase [Parvularcula sp. LCG005]